MQPRQKNLYIFLQVVFGGMTASFLKPLQFPAVIIDGLPVRAEWPLCIAGIMCTAVAILLLMVYIAQEEKGTPGSLPFSAVCRHALQVVLLLLCMLPALLLFSILEGLYFWLIAPYFFNAFQPGSGFPSFLGLFLATLPALATLFLLPLAFHPFFSMLIYPRPIRETFRHALQTWKTMYKPLLFWCTAIIAIQTALSLISSAIPYGFSEIIPILSSAVLQTLFFYKMLARYVSENSVA